MAVREGLMSLLHTGSRYGYQLKTEFEAATGGVWPLNIGQVYTTLDRLERDGLVAHGEHRRAARAAANDASPDDTSVGLVASLVAEALLMRAQADLRWLDRCEARLAARKRPPATRRRTPKGSS